ncbi:MAG TPA: hypothetical protein VE934_03330 [Polaromonas sp.]|uniref:hypothetical protein n=1 Tax=Polaromonas sp. TaxID=1869339 RepID=UPI002D43B350|nr:hypothetical protein [Polaromonas sp.]HYW55962.1 hypothetical protein [Polaromonas sp.]
MTPPRKPSPPSALALSGLSKSYLQLASLLVLGAAATLISLGVNAQSAGTPASPAAAQVQEAFPVISKAAKAATPAEPAKPVAAKYSDRDIDRAFGYMDANRDGKLSREEASGFRNVAKYFDLADTDKNTVLSRDEFAKALNRKKPAVATTPAAPQAAVKQ